MNHPKPMIGSLGKYRRKPVASRVISGSGSTLAYRLIDE